MTEIRTIELFAGYGSQLLALRRLERDFPGTIKVTPVAFAENDKHATKAYRALHGDDIPNLGDVTAVDWSVVPGDIDLLTYSFPCTDISMAGRQEGLKEGSGTASSLLWECRRAISALRPRFAVMENVANLLSKHHKPEFDRWCREMEDMGYVNYCRILNAKDYNVPQNRRRVFMVSILGGERDYQFPAPMPLERPLKSLLERGVDEKYYIPDERVAILLSSAKLEKVTGGDPAVLGWTRDKKGEIVDRHPVDIANCVTASPRDNTMNYVLNGHAVRKLSCRELFRLMDVEDKDIDTLLGSGVSKTQLAKMAGNSIVVNVLYHIFRQLFVAENAEPQENGQLKLF